MKVRELMDTKYITIPKGSTYEQVFKILYDNNISGAPIVDDGKIIGIVSEKDLFRVLFPFYTSYYNNPELYVDYEERENKVDEIKNHKVDVFMSRDFVYVHPDDPVLRAGALMLAKHVSRLPVIENGKLVGMIWRRDIYKTILKRKLLKEE
ncbi:MAG: CBS domain-containing protein [Candidatus Magasanikbacteria bacterium]|nr:CBS domain-containing protein [Candidatus Magasanikbacteria bacterium]